MTHPTQEWESTHDVSDAWQINPADMTGWAYARPARARDQQEPDFWSYPTPDYLAGEHRPICAGVGDAMFPELGGRWDAKQAIELCLQCPLIDGCREWAIENREEHGIWGGTTPSARRAAWIRADRRAAAALQEDPVLQDARAMAQRWAARRAH